jgi:hypothetical protein
MNTAKGVKEQLQELLQGLSAADRSVLAATLETPDSQIATVRNSANDQLWSRLVELGYAREMVLDIDLPPALKHIQPRSFALTASGRAALAELLAKTAPPRRR